MNIRLLLAKMLIIVTVLFLFAVPAAMIDSVIWLWSVLLMIHIVTISGCLFGRKFLER